MMNNVNNDRTNQTKLYARVVDGKIVEYPVYPGNISARGQNVSLYSECVEINKPSTTDGTVGVTYDLSYSVTDNKVYVVYQTYPLGVDALLSKLYPTGWEPRVKYSDIDPKLGDAIICQIGNYVDKYFDTFVATRKYSNVGSCIAWADPTSNSKMAVEGQYVKTMYMEAWDVINAKTNDILSGAMDVPGFKDIQEWLPSLEWPNAATKGLIDTK